MKWEGRRQSSNVDDRRGISAKGGLIAGGVDVLWAECGLGGEF